MVIHVNGNRWGCCTSYKANKANKSEDLRKLSFRPNVNNEYTKPQRTEFIARDA